MKSALAIGLGLAVAAWASAGRASEVSPGLDYEVLPGQFGGGPVYALRVDLKKFRIIQTDPTKPLQTSAGGFALATGAIAVTNSDFWPNALTGPPVGLLAGSGHVAQDSVLWYAPPTFMASMGFRSQDGFAKPFDSQGLLHGPVPDCLTDVFTGSDWALKGGSVPLTTLSTDQGLVTRHPRTILGLSKDRTSAFVFVTQGRGVPAGALGYTVVGSQSIGQIALARGAWDAINLDGGGSSIMWVAGAIKNSPTDGAERRVAYHLGVVPVQADAGTSTNACVSDAGAAEAGSDAAPPVDAGAPATTDSGGGRDDHAPREETSSAAPPGDGGSGCAVTGASGSAGAIALSCLGLLGLARRRRRRQGADAQPVPTSVYSRGTTK